MKKSKITFIYAYETEEWSTPMALAREFESRGWEIEFVSIGSNGTGQYHDRDLQLWIQQAIPTDIVLFLDFGRFDSVWLDKKWTRDQFWIQESGDDPQNFDRNFPKSYKFDMTLSPDMDSVDEYLDRGVNAHWWTHFADTRVQYPLKSMHEYVAVTTRGEGGSEFLDQMTSHGAGSVGNKNGLNANDHTVFLNKGLMVLQNSRFGEITRRIFEGMACGKMVLTDRLSENKKLHELFEDGKDIVYYDNMVDCINKMNYYVDNPKERDEIAVNGYNTVLTNHTQVERVDFILQKWKEHV